MKRKRYTKLLIIGIIILLININSTQAADISDFQKIEIKISKISWIKSDDFGSYYENKSVIKIITNLTINNPNNNSLELEYPTYPMQTYGTKTEITLSNKKLETLFWCLCGGLAQVISYGSIPAGISTNESISYLIMEEEGLENLPDGRYVFWNYIYAHGETLSNSTRALVRINNGEHTIDYNYTPTITLSLPRYYIVFSVIFIAVLIGYSRKINLRK